MSITLTDLIAPQQAELANINLTNAVAVVSGQTETGATFVSTSEIVDGAVVGASSWNDNNLTDVVSGTLAALRGDIVNALQAQPTTPAESE